MGDTFLSYYGFLMRQYDPTLPKELSKIFFLFLEIPSDVFFQHFMIIVINTSNKHMGVPVCLNESLLIENIYA
jgi:hypothetical protein